MNNLKVSNSQNHFVYDSKPFFLLSDTLWTAFSNIKMEEWIEYLNYRQAQNFNGIQINILTQWDGGKPDLNIYPFKLDNDNKFDFSCINDEYFTRAQKMLEIAVEKGFIPELVVLWGNYVKDTWMSDNNPVNIMPLDMVGAYTEYVVNVFGKFNPIYIISGDTDFRSEVATKYYLTALTTIRRLQPEAVITAHLCGGIASLPKEFSNEAALNYYMYQSSHNIESQHLAYTLAEKFHELPEKKPVVNGEPCYEGHAFGGKYGRYDEFHVRKAIWQSLLSGAPAGVTYGAHGVWGWYSDGKEFFNEGYGGRPLSWRNALRLKGAWDASYARWIIENFGLFDIEPAKCILNDTEEIRCSVSADKSKIAFYAPYNTDIKVSKDLSAYDFSLINLKEKFVAKPTVLTVGGSSVIRMHDFNSDVLILGKRKL